MKGFVEFMGEERDHSAGTYVAAWLDKATQKKLEEFADKHEIKNQLPPEDYHSTISYSKTPVPAADDLDWKVPIKGKFLKWAKFENRIEGGEYLVAIVKSETLDEYHEKMMNMGASHDFPEYHAHISLSSNFEGPVPKETPDFDFVYDRVEVKPLDPNFKPRKK